MSWVLFEEVSGWCIVNEKNVLQAGQINVGDICTFWYQGIEYKGKVLMIDEVYDNVNDELTKLKKNKNRQPQNAVTEESLPPKRNRLTAASFYGATSNSNPPNKKKKEERAKMSEEAKNRQRLLEANRKEAEKQANNQLLTKLKNDSASSDNVDLDHMNEDEDSQDSVITDMAAHGNDLRDNRQHLLKTLKYSSSKSTSSTATRQGTNRQGIRETNKKEHEKQPNNKPLLKRKNETVSHNTPLSDEECLNSLSEDRTHLKSQMGPHLSSRNTSLTAVMQGENRQRILNMNIKESMKWAVKKPVSKPKEHTNDDSEWVPSQDEESQDSVSGDMVHQANAFGDEQTHQTQSLSGPSFSSFSPTKEELKRQNELLRMKVQLAHDKMSEMNKKDKSLEPRNKGNANEVQGSTDNAYDGEEDGSGHQDNDLSVEEGQGIKDNNKECASTEKADDSMPGSQASSNGNPDKAGQGEDDLLPEEEQGMNNKKKGAKNDTADDSKQNDGLDTYLDYQLYGERKDITTELCRKIFCKTDVLATALTNSTNINHLCRRLMHGVFIPSKIVDCTVSGQSWHAGGPEKLMEQKKPLHPGALKAILDFSNGVAKRKKWPSKKFGDVKSIFSLRLGEIRKLVANGKLKD